MKRRKSTRDPAVYPLRNKETRGTILAVAGKEFAASGLAGARTDTIAAKARVNKALLYYYFKSKEDLYAAVVEDYFREFNSRALVVLNSKGPAQEILLQYVSLHMDFISRKQQSAPLFQQLTMDNQRFLKRLIPKYFRARSQAMDNLLKRGMRSGEFRKVDRFQAAVSIVSLIVFYFSAARVLKLLGRTDAYSKANLKRRKHQVLDFIRHGLFTTAD